MPIGYTWPGGVAMETIIPKDSAGSCDSVISMNSNFSDDSLDGLEPEVRDSLMFLDETLVSLELEEDSGLSNDEFDPHTPTPHSQTLSDNKVTICLPAHTWAEDVSKYHEDPNQVMGRDHKPSMRTMVPTPLLLANGPSLLRSRTSFSTADHKPKPVPHTPAADVGIPKPTSDTVSLVDTTSSPNRSNQEGSNRDKLTTVQATVAASEPANPAEVNTIKATVTAPEVTPSSLNTDAQAPATDEFVGPSELISDKPTADPAEMINGSVANTSGTVELPSTDLVDGQATVPTATEMQAPDVSKDVSRGSTESSSAAGIIEDASSAYPVGDATTTPPHHKTHPVEVCMEFIPPPVAFMDEPVEDQDTETPAPSGINLSDIPALHGPVKDLSEESIPAPDIPASDIPAQNVQDGTLPECDIPAPDIPAQNAPDTTFPACDIPAPNISAQNFPDTIFPACDIPAPDIPAQNVANTSVLACDIPAPDIPAQNIPDTTFPAFDIPAPDVPQDVTDSVFPASDIPAPVVLSSNVPSQDVSDAVIPTPHVSPQVLSDVIPPPGITAQDSLAPDIPTPIIPTPDPSAPAISASDIPSQEENPKIDTVLSSPNLPKEAEAVSIPPASQRGPLSYNELEKLRKKASLKKAPSTAPVCVKAAPSHTSPTTEGLPGPPQEYCDPKSPPAVAPKPKKLPPNIIIKPHRSADSLTGPLISGNRVRAGMDKNKVHMEALRKLGLIKCDETDAASCSGPSLSPRSRRSWGPSSGLSASSPGANSSGPPTPEPHAQPVTTAQSSLVLQPPGPKAHQLPGADRHSPKVSPAPNRKMVEVRLAPQMVPVASGEGDSVLLRSDEDDLEIPDHLPPSPPKTNTPQNLENSSATRCHGISVEISPLSSKDDRREALRKLGLLRD